MKKEDQRLERLTKIALVLPEAVREIQSSKELLAGRYRLVAPKRLAELVNPASP